MLWKKAKNFSCGRITLWQYQEFVNLMIVAGLERTTQHCYTERQFWRSRTTYKDRVTELYLLHGEKFGWEHKLVARLHSTELWRLSFTTWRSWRCVCHVIMLQGPHPQIQQNITAKAHPRMYFYPIQGYLFSLEKQCSRIQPGYMFRFLSVFFFEMRWKGSYGAFSRNSIIWLKVVKKYYVSLVWLWQPLHFESTSLAITSAGQISHIHTSPNGVLLPGPKPQASPQFCSGDSCISPNTRTHQTPFSHWTKVIDGWCSNSTTHGWYGNGTIMVHSPTASQPEEW